MNPYLFGSIMFFAALTKGFAGFGQALVAVPLLASALGLAITSPLMSLFAVISNAYMLFQYRKDANWREMWRLSLASLIAVPLGVWGLRAVDQRIILGILGGMLIAYALYALLNPRLPRLRNPRLAYGFGFVAGLLGGAYNTAGPPAVIYGSFRGWEPAEFKGTLQAFFMLNGIMVAASHLISHNFSRTVLTYFLIAIPFLLAGTFVGMRLDKYFSPVLFRKAVLVLLIILGATLIF